ncbi:MAG: tetratricopeptide repeat protein [Elusimicrobiota bacterium]
MERVSPRRGAPTGRRPAAMFAALALPILCALAGAEADAPWRKQLDQAEHLLDDGQKEEAMRTAQGVLKNLEAARGPDAPETGRVLAFLTRIYLTSGDVAKFPEMEARLSAVKSKGFEAWLALGGVLREEEKYRDAEDAIEKALAYKPDDVGAKYHLALLYEDMGRFDEEIVALKGMIARQPSRFALAKLAQTYTRLGRASEAEKAYSRANAVEPKGADAGRYIEEGYFNLHAGKVVQAEEDFESAVDLDTANPAAYHHLGAYYEQTGNYPEAEKHYRRALELLQADPRTKAADRIHTIFLLGNVLMREGRAPAAQAVYRKCLDDPAPVFLNVCCLQALSDSYVSENRLSPAEETLRRAAAACAEGPECSCRGMADIALGRFYLERGRRLEASSLADRAAKSCASYHALFEPFISLALAQLYGKLGDASKEKGFYERSVAERGSLQFVFMLPAAADMAMDLGRFDEAEDIYRQGIRIYEDRGDRKDEAAMLDGLASACEKNGKPREAADARRKASLLKAPE